MNTSKIETRADDRKFHRENDAGPRKHKGPHPANVRRREACAKEAGRSRCFQFEVLAEVERLALTREEVRDSTCWCFAASHGLSHRAVK